MTRLCVAIFVTDLDKARRDIALAGEAGADLVELRIDQFTDAPLLKSLISGSTLPCIVTCRPVWEGGQNEMPEEERLGVLVESAESYPAFIDVELAALRSRNDQLERVAERFFTANVRGNLPERPRLIVSAHDFAGRPPRLTNLLIELTEGPGDINKLVWTARTVRDNLEAFEILLHRQKPTIALCMGEHGLSSRILAKKFGAFLTFASLTADGGTARGQVTIDDMKRLYRWDAIGPQTKVYGVVGSPVMHSMSPAIHNAAFDAIGFDGVYLPLLINPGYESFKAFMESFLAFEPLHLSGLSVTLPHKENALRYLKEKGAEIEPLANDIGAVNTIVIDLQDGRLRLRGRNTDYAAILDSITAKLGITREQLADYRVAVLGAGGTGRTAVAALAHYGATVVIYNRTRERADELAKEFTGRRGKVVAAPLEKVCDSCCQIYLNTTSVGMYPKVDENPFGEAPPTLTDEIVVFDTIYNPIRTKLLQQAEAAGAKTISGVEMFVRQAVGQFEAWTAQTAPAEIMRGVIERRLARVE